MTNHKVLPQESREHPDPHESLNPVPVYLHWMVGLLLAFCVTYIGASQVDSPSSWGDGRTRAELVGSKPAAGGHVDGAATFASTCAACHQTTGSGLPGVFPPLAGSEWVNGRDTTVAAIVLNGITGSLTVKGSTYNGTMPTFKAQLSDDQIAAVLTYVRAQWGNTSPAIKSDLVAKVRDDTKGREGPFGGDKELQALK
jgi:mono/diheme cytochrome c family protein